MAFDREPSDRIDDVETAIANSDLPLTPDTVELVAHAAERALMGSFIEAAEVAEADNAALAPEVLRAVGNLAVGSSEVDRALRRDLFLMKLHDRKTKGGETLERRARRARQFRLDDEIAIRRTERA